MLRQPVSEQTEKIIAKERLLLLRVNTFLAALDATPKDLQRVQDGLTQLDQLFLLVVVGEFNSGKSALINALLGEPVLREGVTPTTANVHLLRYGQEKVQQQKEDGIVYVDYPAPWLRYLNVVDTPGTNAVIRRHQEITEAFVPRSDLVLFVTSVDRPFTDSERQFLQSIRSWGKKIILVLNKIDLLQSEAELEKVVSFVQREAQRTLSLEIIPFPVSVRMAHKEENDLPAWQRGRFQTLREALLQRLDERERLQLKLRNPLGVSTRMLDRYADRLAEQQTLLQEDRTALAKIDQRLSAYEAEMRRDFVYHLSHIQKVIYQMSARGDRFLDEHVRLTRFFDLLNSEKMRGAFEREVMADTAAQVDHQVSDLIDWLVEKDFEQWQAIMSFTNEQVVRYRERVIGEVTGRFAMNRRQLLESIGEAARRSVASYDKEAEARQLADSIQIAVAQTALVEVSAIGLGALLVKVLAATMADVTGILAAGVLATAGLYLIPARRQKAKKTLHRQVEQLQNELKTALQNAFEKELGLSLQRIQAALTPYEHFVRREMERLQTQQETLTALRDEMKQIEEQISTL